MLVARLAVSCRPLLRRRSVRGRARDPRRSPSTYPLAPAGARAGGRAGHAGTRPTPPGGGPHGQHRATDRRLRAGPGRHPPRRQRSDDEQLAFRPDAESNSIAWLAWHLTRVQDDHVAHLAGDGQRWLDGGWADRFALPLDPSDTGYGHDPDQVALVVAGARDLLDYFEDVHAATAGLPRHPRARATSTGWSTPGGTRR